MIDKNLTTSNNFTPLADYLLNKVILNVNGTKFRLAEIEFYYHDTTHLDEYTHKNDNQLEYEKIYFHKLKTGTYKAGTFKGMDIALGNRETNKYFGVLIRSIYDIESKKLIEGPCNSVDKLLLLNGSSNVKEFMDKRNGKLIDLVDKNESVRLEEATLPRLTLCNARRIGLADDKYPEFRELSYRYAVLKDFLKKEKSRFKKVDF